VKRTGPAPILWAAFGAALGSTVIELLLWSIAGEDAVRNLLRDARLTAAIVMGRRVLGPAAGFDPLVMSVATLVHGVLSLIYAAVLAKVVRGMSLGPRCSRAARSGSSCTASTCMRSPRFSRGSFRLTLVAHLVFGITAAGIYRVAGRQP